MVYRGIPWYYKYYMAYHDMTWQTVVDHAFSYIVLCMVIVWYRAYHGLPVSKPHGIFTMVYLFQNTMVFYHGLPVSKHHGILPWFSCFKTPWYFTMVYLFQNTMVFYHGIRWRPK